MSHPDPAAAASFYGGVLGWELEETMPPGSPGSYLMARLDGLDVAAIGSQQGGGGPPAWMTYVAVESADDAAARAREAGGTTPAEPFDIFDAGRMAVLADPSGAVICVWQAGRHRGAQLVNAPGSWVFSELHTGDPDAAEAFYGAVFGWVLDPIVLGDGVTGDMWRRPGYGDHLAERDPDLRRRLVEYEAPPGFEDAVAWLEPLREGESPHWSVTFSVDDADACADRAAELGGTVLVPPFVAGPTRVAVLADPAGAAFSVSRFDPG